MANETVRGLWMALAVVWVAAAFAAKKAARTEMAGARIGHILTMAVAFGLLFWPAMRVGVLGWRVIPDGAASGAAAVAVTAAGVLLAIWARFQLGGNWSAIVAVKQGHTLVQSGPYAAVRHPIYSGILAAMAGTAIGCGEAGGFLGVVLAFAAFQAKARSEEWFLLTEFGEGYREYRTRVSALIPFIL